MNGVLLVLVFLAVCLLFSRVLTMPDRALEDRIWQRIVRERPEVEHMVFDDDGNLINESLLDREDSDDD